MAARTPQAGWLAPAALFLGCALLYAINLNRQASFDELYHVLAARGLLLTGEPRIAEGLYTRSLAFTWLVAQSFRLFGESLWAARLPALLPVAATTALLFVWLRREAGGHAAWIAALLFGLSPFAVDTARFIRFYGLQCLSFLGASLLVYAAFEPGRRLAARGGLLLAGAVLAAFATYLQPTTLIGLLGLAAWAAGSVLLPWLRAAERPRRVKAMLLGGLLLAALLLLAFLAASGLLAELWARYRWTPLFNQATQDQPWYYHLWLDLYYPSLWPLFPFLALVAVAARPRPALLALVVFAAAFVLQSFAAAKNLRYLIYAQPFLFALLGMGLAALLDRLAPLWSWLGSGLALRVGRVPARLLLAGAALFLLLANTATIRSLALLAGVTVPPEEPDSRWSLARAPLAPWLDGKAVVVTTSELESLYYLGRFDLLMSRSRLSEMDDQAEFARDPRTGRPVLRETASLERVMACYPRGVFVSNERKWRAPHQMPEDAADLLASRGREVPMPKGWHIVAYVWERPGAGDPAACAGLPPLPELASG